MNSKSPYLLTLILILLWFGGESASVGSHSPKLWPEPRSFQWLQPHPESNFLCKHFTISSPPQPHLAAAVHRYHRLILSIPHQPLSPPPLPIPLPFSPPLQSLKISVYDLFAPLVHGVDESYNLTVARSSAVLSAGTVWGAMRGLETFYQLVFKSPDSIAIAVGLQIWDSPLFPHRGVLLDTSRNFYPVDDILRTIGAMSATKLNVFHWHITDSQSFPLVLPSEPALARKGSYGPKMQYSPQDVKRIIQFGFDHGVRVMPEIDSPGHTGSWAEAYPDIVSCAGKFWWPAGSDWADRLASEPGSGQLNPLSPNTYRVMSNVIKDISSLFPETFFHGGADEVVPGCWKSDPSIQTFLSNNGTLSELLETFISSTLPTIVAHNKTAVYWEDVLLDSTISVGPKALPREHVILQTWNGGPANTKRLVSAGYRTIVSSADYYYLDCGHGGFVGNDSQYDTSGAQGNGGSWCNPFKTWQRVYDYDIADGLSFEERKLVMGGEVALWSEQADPTVVDGRLWPRAAAMGEALWSGNRDGAGRKRYAEATDRLTDWRYRMVERGVAAEPIQPLWCVRNPGMCNTLNSDT